MGLGLYFKKSARAKSALLLSLWVILALAAFCLRSVLLPFMLAALLAYVLEPLVSGVSHCSLMNRSCPRWLAIMIVYALIVAFFYVLGAFFLPELYQESLRLTAVASDWVNQLNATPTQQLMLDAESFFHRYGLPIQLSAPLSDKPPLEVIQDEPTHHYLLSINVPELLQDLSHTVTTYLKNESTHIVTELQSMVGGLVQFIFKFFLVLMISGFILVDTARIRRFLFRLIPPSDRDAFQSFLTRVDTGLSGVVRGQLLICLINALLTLIGLVFLQVKFALILATLAGLFSLIPIFGSVLSTIPIALVALLTSPLTVLLALGWIIFIHALEANFLNPKILGNTAQIHPVLVVLALVAGEHFYGIIGALLAVPVASVLLTSFDSLLSKAQTDPS